MPGLVIASVNEHPHLEAEAKPLVEQYLRLPDAWNRFGGVPDLLPEPIRTEIERLPGDMMPPSGDVLVGVCNGVGIAVGCISPLDIGRCELKRVFVAAGHRRSGVGGQLIEELLRRAGTLGYQGVAIDVIPERSEALGVWRRRGFSDCAPYRDDGVEMVFLDRRIPQT